MTSTDLTNNKMLNGDDSLHNNGHLSPITEKAPFEYDDDLGFDPFSESAKALADLLEEELEEKKSRPFHDHKNEYVFLF